MTRISGFHADQDQRRRRFAGQDPEEGPGRRHVERLAVFVPRSEDQRMDRPGCRHHEYIAKMLKIDKVTVQTVTFDGLIPGLLDGRFDIVGDSIHYTKNRSKVVNFCFPTYYYAEGAGGAEGQPATSCTSWPTARATPSARCWAPTTPSGCRRPGREVPGLQGLGTDRSGTRDRPHRCRAVRPAGGAALMKDHPEWKIELRR